MGGKVARRVVWLAVLSLTACARETAEPREDPALLVSALAMSPDSVTRLLIVKQRALFALLAGTDRSALHDFVETGYSWQYPAHDTANLSDAEESALCARCPPFITVYRRPDVSYVQLLAGFKPAVLETLPEEYVVRVEGRMAGVTATRRSSPIRIETYWHLKPEGWRAATTMQSYGTGEFPRRRQLMRPQARR